MSLRAPTASAGPYSAAEIAEHLGGKVEGAAETRLTDVRALSDAGPEHLSFLANPRYAKQLGASRAGAVLLDREAESGGRTVIRCDDPYAAFAEALLLFHPFEWPQPGIDPRAVVADDAVVDGATIEAFAWVGPGAHVGAGTWIESGAYVGRGAVLGERCRLMPHSVVYADAVLGDRVWLNPGVVLGGEGFGFAPTPQGNVKIPQVGRVVIGDDVEIGANSCVDRGAIGETSVGRGTKLDNLVQIGHGARVGEDCLLVAYAGVAGTAKLGNRVVLAAKSGVINHVSTGDDVQVAVGSIVLHDQEAGARVAGRPAIEHGTWLRAKTAFNKLPEMVKRLRRLEKQVAELERQLSER
jgi:UDP-3-O-[3-hydroxymyristoyl] glucosamine N-acyltransferase